MEQTKKFALEAFDQQARIGRLSAEQSEALERAMALFEEGRLPQEGDPGFSQRLALLLPLAEFGLASDLLIKLMLAVPKGWSWDHREIYYDFRLGKWMKHIEPP